MGIGKISEIKNPILRKAAKMADKLGNNNGIIGDDGLEYTNFRALSTFAVKSKKCTQKELQKAKTSVFDMQKLNESAEFTNDTKNVYVTDKKDVNRIIEIPADIYWQMFEDTIK